MSLPPTHLDDSNGSDTELLQDLTAGLERVAQHQATQNYAAMHGGGSHLFYHNTTPELDEDMPGLLEDTGREYTEDTPSIWQVEAPQIADVDDGDGTLQARAGKILGKILRLRGLDAWPSITSAVPSVEPVAVAVARPVSPLAPVSLTYTTLEGGRECLYFVGIQTLYACHTFTERRAFSDPLPHNGALLLRLQHAGGPIGRALATLTDRAAYAVGTSGVLIEIAHNYQSYQHNFQEIASLLALENSGQTSNIFFPSPASSTRSQLLRMQSEQETTPVYVLYVYHMGLDEFRTRDTWAVGAVVTAVAAVAAAAPSEVRAYIRQRFATQLDDLRIWRACDYGSAYHHCLMRRQVMGICQALGIGLLARHHAPSVIGNMSIRLEDVVSAADINT
ncbi:hypothetical protein B0H14DRAFT_3488272 [Mycena olivaceomarginata]|nr:hypothetical protein B0H14DRAFT_3488272 [Mycena olivaceomarginata]